MFSFLQRQLALILTVAVIFLAGTGAGFWRYGRAREAMRSALIIKVRRSAAAFEASEMRQLSADPAGTNALVHAEVKARLLRLHDVEPGVRRVYIFRILPAAGQVQLLADSSPIDAGGVLRFANDADAPELPASASDLENVLAETAPPVADRFGMWITAYAVIGTPKRGEPRDVLGLDVSAESWRRSLWSDSLGTAIYVWMILVLPLVTFVNSRRQTQQRDALRNLTEAMEQSHSAVIIVDLDGRIEYANAGFCQQVGFTRRELIGRPWSEFQGPDVPAELMRELIDTLRSGHPWSGEWSMQRKDASLFPVRGGFTPVKDRVGDTRSYVAVFEDLTEFRATETVLREAKERAEAGDRAKGQFLATMSHEVRTPLNGIVGFSSLLLDTALTPEQQEYVETIRTSSETLIQLTGDILDYARIESGRLKLDPQPCDPRECIENALDLVAAPATNKAIELLHWVDDSVPSAIVADLSRLRQVIVNLVNNAVKFSAEGEVEVAARALSVDAPDAGPTPMCVLEFTVRDTGIGIAPEHHAKIFRPFSQADDSTTRRYGGTGLGLAICKNIVELMEGRISFASEPGRGSIFTFTIRVPVHHAGIPARPPPPLTGRTLAVAATAPGLRRELTRLGARLGAATIEVDPAALAITPGWDVAIMDVTGSAALAIAGARAPQPALPPEKMIGLVPVVLPGELRAELRRHFRLVLNKPLHHDMLLSMLASPSTGLALSPPAPAATRPSLTADTYNLRVLIVEDNAVNQRLIQKVVANLGCEYTTAANGRLALESLARATPDIVLMDLHMPELDGLSATVKIRAGEAGAAARDVWIIALTADAREEQRDRTIAAGANDYLTKPIRLPELTAAFRHYLGARRT